MASLAGQWDSEQNSRRSNAHIHCRNAHDDTNGNANSSGGNNSTVAVRRPAGPAVWSALGRVAGTAWTALKLCHRCVLAPAAVWVLHNLKAYIDEQLAIQRAMATTPCTAPLYGESEVRTATDDLGFSRRALSTPYGMVAYLTRLRGMEVAVRQIPLHRLEDVDSFWSEAAAGRKLLSAGRHVHLVPYMGCCPALACHVYEQRRGTCSLREALTSSSPHGSALSGWETRLAVCEQLASVVAHLLQSGVSARELSTAHVILRLDPGFGGSEGPHCWLAPGCELRTENAAAARQRPPQATQQQPLAASSGRCGGRPSTVFTAAATSLPGLVSVSGTGLASDTAGGDGSQVMMARALGHVLMQLLAGSDAPVPAPSTVLRALADMAPGALLERRVAPPLTDEQAWPLLAAVYSLLCWGAFETGNKPSASPEGGPTATAGGAHSVGAVGPSATTGRGGAAGASGSAAACPGALLRHLTQEVLPVLAELQQQLRRATAATGPAGQGRGVQPPPAPVEGDVFAGASAPPLPAFHPPPPPSPPVAAAIAAGRAPDSFSCPPRHPPPRMASPVRPATAFPPAPASAAASASSSAVAIDVQPIAKHGVKSPPASPAAAPSAPSLPANTSPGPGGRPSGSSSIRRSGPPQELLCPITTELMEDPVVAADGHSYERAAIARWLAGRPGRPTSPLTGAVLPHTALTPNYALRKIIADWREQHGEAWE